MNNLNIYLKKYKKPLLAFSGGADSTFLLYKMKEICSDFLCVALIMPNTSSGDLDRIDRTGENIPVAKIPFSPLDIKEFADNSEDRCYFCKKAMFECLSDYAEKNGCDAVFDGTNASDRGAYRPGMRAKEEAGILSPLLDCGITKDMVLRELEKMNISSGISDSCYATRIAYGEKITMEKLNIIRKTENYLKSLGLSVCRASLMGNLMRIDVPFEEGKTVFDHREEIVGFVRNLGINYVTLDLEGFVSGKQDR